MSIPKRYLHYRKKRYAVQFRILESRYIQHERSESEPIYYKTQHKNYLSGIRTV